MEKMEESHRLEVEEFLKEHEAASLLLVGNLRAHGLRLTDHPNSSDVMLRRDGEGRLVAVWGLTRRGNLLLQSRPDAGVHGEILEHVLRQPLPFHGFLGDQSDWERLLPELVRRGRVPAERSFAKERLYELSLGDGELAPPPHTAVWSAGDVATIKLFRKAFADELQLPFVPPRDEDLLAIVAAGTGWACFEEERLVAVAQLNARSEGVGLVGGVYTALERRRRGFCKDVMGRLIWDCRNLLGIRKLVLFTGDHQVGAWRTYEGLGFRRVGDFAMNFF